MDVMLGKIASHQRSSQNNEKAIDRRHRSGLF